MLAGKNSICIEQIIDIAHEAGKIILKIYNSDDYSQVEKSDFSPLTTADMESHNLIVRQLQKITPDVPILSEESAYIPWKQRKNWREYWLIDPLDGTKEFIKKNGEFTVNMALIKDHIPEIGVVHAPVFDETWVGEKDKFARKITQGRVKNIRTCPHRYGEKWRVVGSRSHVGTSLNLFLEKLDDYELIPMGSSMKFCQVAEGKAHVYLRLGPTSEWDTAAAHAVVNSAGGSIIDLTTNKPLLYNTKDSTRNGHFLVRAQ